MFELYLLTFTFCVHVYTEKELNIYRGNAIYAANIFLIKETFYIVAFLMFKVGYFQSQSGS